ncbi:membrane protein insertion efficiency factor YidD [Zooshikella harenae]|uniref:Membrane protein insertion efficiency factor YidD n=1 Tax=Zooshikella harenae TaxID=2827238 RepID=A0ABS5ZDZ2_9GAMM|nr:membrane protein insertion efficiency factor YidD [Zooshikella harenae]MBU2712048.1 membrane protein insertion efficiency factor YidD [Zooshikella harenae]
MRQTVLYLIKLYQRYISPYKGFRCAHAALSKRDSCSVAVSKIIARRGGLKGYQDIKKQFLRCANASQYLEDSKRKDKKPRKKDNPYYCCLDMPVGCCVLPWDISSGN